MSTGLETALLPLAKEKGLLSLVYQDLAQPGVKQVGKALSTVLGLGNTILIPLRMLNKAGEAAEKRTFDEIAKRFSQIPQDDIIEVRPQIGVPLIEKLSYNDDPTLRSLFIELLASAASASNVEHAHPSFPNIIENLSPDEAKVLAFLKNTKDVPMIELRLDYPGEGYRPIFGYQIDCDCELTYPQNIGLYISNLRGLGIVEIMRDSWLSNRDEDYELLFESSKKSNGITDTCNFEGKEMKVGYSKQVMRILPLGRKFMAACIPNADR